MKITYNFVNGETIEIEVNEEIGEIILESRRKEETESRRIRYNERRLDTVLDRGDWNKFIQPEFDELTLEQMAESMKKAIKMKLAFKSLTGEQRSLIMSLYGANPKTEKEIAEKEGVTQQAIHNRKEKIRKKLKKFL